MAIRLRYTPQTVAAVLTSASLALLLDPGRNPPQLSDLAFVLYNAVIILVFFLGLFNLSVSLINNAEEKLGSFAVAWFHAVSGTSLAIVFALRLWISAVPVSAFCASTLVFLAAVTVVLGFPLLAHLYCKRRDSVSLDKEQI